jgi:C-terminal processing protease CtpA/Prc
VFKQSQILLLIFTALLHSACDIPSLPLTAEERRADLDWVFATFKHNYAPLDYKKQKHQVEFNLLKQECLEKSDSITQGAETNSEFRALVSLCVSRFQDAHTTNLQSGMILPGNAKVAYLGFTTQRIRKKIGDDTLAVLAIDKLLPSVDEKQFPLKKDDLILKIDDKSVDTVLEQELVPYRNLGQTSASLRAASLVFALRDTMRFKMPTAPDVKLLIRRGDENFEIQVPWSIQDLYAFQAEQQHAQLVKKVEEKKTEVKKGDEDLSAGHLWLPSASPLSNVLRVVHGALLGHLDDFEKLSNAIEQHRLRFLLEASFTYYDPNPSMAAITDAASDALEKLKKERTISADNIVTDLSSGEFPAYILRKANDTENVGYIRISTFDMTNDSLKTLGAIFKAMNKNRIKGLILDLIDNTGGSLVHGLRLANMLSSKSLEYPHIRFALNNSWYRSFQSLSTQTSDPLQREWAQRIVNKLQADLSKPQRPRLSSSMSTLELDRYSHLYSKNSGYVADGVKIAVLINEMCASMCDIFASVFKDNNLGRVIGMKSMGAGGNVTSHFASPVAGIILNQTESLLFNKAGVELENNGIEPDLEFDTVADRTTGFSGVITKALAELSIKSSHVRLP